MKIRKGSRTFDMTREDLENIYSKRLLSVDPFQNNVTITFKDKKLSQVLKVASYEALPSVIEKHHLEMKINQYEKLIIDDPKEYKRLTSILHPLGNFQIGSSGLPELKNKLAKVSSNKKIEDTYYLYETSANKIQLFIHNSGTSPLKNVLMSIKIPKNEYISVVEKVPQKSINYPSISILNNIYTPVFDDISEEETLVKFKVGDVQHHLETEALVNPIRITVISSAIDSFKIEVTLHAENLANPISTYLQFTIED